MKTIIHQDIARHSGYDQSVVGVGILSMSIGAAINGILCFLLITWGIEYFFNYPTPEESLFTMMHIVPFLVPLAWSMTLISNEKKENVGVRDRYVQLKTAFATAFAAIGVLTAAYVKSDTMPDRMYYEAMHIAVIVSAIIYMARRIIIAATHSDLAYHYNDYYEYKGVLIHPGNLSLFLVTEAFIATLAAACIVGFPLIAALVIYREIDTLISVKYSVLAILIVIGFWKCVVPSHSEAIRDFFLQSRPTVETFSGVLIVTIGCALYFANIAVAVPLFILMFGCRLMLVEIHDRYKRERNTEDA